jgi:hypothetical protein
MRNSLIFFLMATLMLAIFTRFAVLHQYEGAAVSGAWILFFSIWGAALLIAERIDHE